MQTIRGELHSDRLQRHDKCLSDLQDANLRERLRYKVQNLHLVLQLVLGTGKPLEEGRTLAYYNIQEGTTLHMIPKHRNNER